MRVRVSQEETPQYFTKSYRGPLKKSWFDAWYRGCKAQGVLKSAIKKLVIANKEFFRETPEYTEGAICGKVKPQKCPMCGGTGLADSGGVHPWGEPILIECNCGKS